MGKFNAWISVKSHRLVRVGIDQPDGPRVVTLGVVDMASKFPSESLGYRYWLAVGDLIDQKENQHDAQ